MCDWLTKLDLKDAYPSVPIYSSSFQWKRLMVAVQGPSIRPQQCSFHLRQAVEASSYYLRKLGTCTILYLEDMLIMARSKEEASRHLAAAMEFADRSGFYSEYKEEYPHSNIGIGHSCMYGFYLHSQDMTVALSLPKL